MQQQHQKWNEFKAITQSSWSWLKPPNGKCICDVFLFENNSSEYQCSQSNQPYCVSGSKPVNVGRYPVTVSYSTQWLFIHFGWVCAPCSWPSSRLSTLMMSANAGSSAVQSGYTVDAFRCILLLLLNVLLMCIIQHELVCISRLV